MKRMNHDNSPNQDLLFSRELGIVFLFISKNASSSLKALLQGHHIGDSRSRTFSRNPHAVTNKFLQGVHALGHPAMSKLLEDSTVPKAVVGRHPIPRLLSAFNSRLVTWNSESYNSKLWDRQAWVKLRQEIVGSLNGQHSSTPVAAANFSLTLDHVVEYLATTPSGNLDRHLTPQTYYAATDLIDYSIVGRVEQLPSFVKKLQREFGLKVRGEIPHLNSVSRDLNDISESNKAAIQIRYKRDFDYFDYR